MKSEHGETVGYYLTHKWNTLGVKAIWDAAERHAFVAGGDDEFVARLREHTSLFAGLEMAHKDNGTE